MNIHSIAGFGDSITAGIHVEQESTFLYKLAAIFGCRAVQAGVPGQTTSQALERLQESVLDHKPDICIVEFGMNDHVALAVDTPKVSRTDFTANLAFICQQIKQYGGIPILCTIHPIFMGNAEQYYYARHQEDWYQSPAGAQAWIDSYNEAIRGLASKDKLPLADIAAYWADYCRSGGQISELLRTIENSGSDDGVHPTPKGHDLYARCIARRLESLLSP